MLYMVYHGNSICLQQTLSLSEFYLSSDNLSVSDYVLSNYGIPSELFFLPVLRQMFRHSSQTHFLTVTIG